MATRKSLVNVNGLLKRGCFYPYGFNRVLNRCAWTSVQLSSYNARNIDQTVPKFSISCRRYATSGKSIFSYSDVDYVVNVKTGDQIHAGTDANVFIILHSETGEKSKPIKLDYFFRDDFERGQLDVFQLKAIAHLKDIHKIELWRDEKGLASEWFLDYIEIESVASRKRFMFPAFRWIKPNKHYVIRHMDNCLPQFEPEPVYRAEELQQKKEHYECAMKVPGGPAQVSHRPHGHHYLYK